jgi:hypothetical protein
VKWRQVSGILYDKKVPNKLKNKFYMMTIRSAMMYSIECWDTKEQHIQKMCSWNANARLDMRPHKERSNQKWWYTGQTWGNTNSREVGPTPFAMVWSYPTKASEAPVRSGILSHPENIRRERGRPRLTWEEEIKKNLKEWNISKEFALDRSAWKTAIHVSEPWFRS